MLYEIFDHMHLCTDEAVSEMLSLVSDQRRQQALGYNHTFGRFCCLKSYLMLTELLSAVYPELDRAKPEFGYNADGKPFLICRPDIHFSISHTKNAILVAISDAPIGVDIETFRSPSESLIERTMNHAEQKAIAAIGRTITNTTDGNATAKRNPIFSAIWTRKEAVLKLRGTGIQGDLKNLLSGPEHIYTKIVSHKAYAFSIAQYPPAASIWTTPACFADYLQ